MGKKHSKRHPVIPRTGKRSTRPANNGTRKHTDMTDPLMRDHTLDPHDAGYADDVGEPRYNGVPGIIER